MAVLYRKDLSRESDTTLYIDSVEYLHQRLESGCETSNDNIANASLPAVHCPQILGQQAQMVEQLD